MRISIMLQVTDDLIKTIVQEVLGHVRIGSGDLKPVSSSAGKWGVFEDVNDAVAAAKALSVGRADDPKTDVGPMVSAAAADRVMGMCEDAIKRGASYALKPTRDGATVSPGILVQVPQAARLWCEEVFGPIAIVTPFSGIEEALTLANDSAFGLQGAIFTSNLRSAFRFADDFDVGCLWVNEPSRFRVDNYPFGGVKNSGVGREGLRYAIEEMSQLKFVGIKP